MDWLKRPGFFQEEREFFVIVCRARGVLYGPLHRNTCLQGQRRSEFVRAAERIIRFVTLIIRIKEMKKTCVLGTYLPIALGVILFSTLIDAKEAQCFKCSRIEFRNATSATVLINPVTAPNDEIDVPWRKPKPTESAIFTCQNTYKQGICDFIRVQIWKVDPKTGGFYDPIEIQITDKTCLYWVIVDEFDAFQRYKLIPK